MEGAILQFIVTAAVIVFAGIVLTRCSDSIAELTGIGRLLAGSIFLALATSLPELSVGVNAVRLGMADLAVGDLLGSSLFNLLILAVLDLTYPPRWRMFSRISTAHALSATQSITLTTLAAFGIALGSRFAPYAIGGVGVFSLAILVAYLLGIRMVFLDQKLSAREKQSVESDPRSVAVAPVPGSLSKAILGYLLSAVAILISGPFLATAADEIAEKSGLGQTFVGTVFVALCTSLPELVASLTAVRMGAPDLALGNIFGSNIFNMTQLVPLDLVHQGPLLAAVSPSNLLTALAIILVTAVAITGQLYQVERRIHFLEPDALLVILLVIGALVLLYYLR